MRRASRVMACCLRSARQDAALGCGRIRLHSCARACPTSKTWAAHACTARKWGAERITCLWCELSPMRYRRASDARATHKGGPSNVREQRPCGTRAERASGALGARASDARAACKRRSRAARERRPSGARERRDGGAPERPASVARAARASGVRFWCACDARASPESSKSDAQAARARGARERRPRDAREAVKEQGQAAQRRHIIVAGGAVVFVLVNVVSVAIVVDVSVQRHRGE